MATILRRSARPLGSLDDGADSSAERALGGFKRIPQWMRRNREVAAFLQWLQARNGSTEPGRRVGFYGLGLYSLRASMAEVLQPLDASARWPQPHVGGSETFPSGV